MWCLRQGLRDRAVVSHSNFLTTTNQPHGLPLNDHCIGRDRLPLPDTVRVDRCVIGVQYIQIVPRVDDREIAIVPERQLERRDDSRQGPSSRVGAEFEAVVGDLEVK